MKKRLRTCLLVIAGLIGLILLACVGFLYLVDEGNRAKPVKLEGKGGIYQAMVISEIATSPDLSGVLLAGSWAAGGTPIYSLDGGATWKTVPAPLPWQYNYTPQYAALTRSKHGEARFSLGGGDNDAIFIPHAVFQAGPGQKGWWYNRIPSCPDGYGRSMITDLSASPADPRRVYLINECDDYDYDSAVFHKALTEVYASIDGGQAFSRVYQKADQFDEAVSDGTAPLPRAILPSPVIPGRVYLGVEQVSEDGGATWTPTHFPVDTLVLDGVDPDRLYGLRKGSPYLGTGLTRLSPTSGWKEWSSQPCQDIKQLAAHPTKTGVLFLLCAHRTTGKMYDYPAEQALLLSTDAGESWKTLSEWSGSWIGPDYGAPGRVLWARSDGLWATTDLGEHWSLVTPDYLTCPAAREWKNLTPPSGPWTCFQALALVSPEDIWAGGHEESGLVHWDGKAWSRSPYTDDPSITVHSMVFASSDNGWMIAYQYDSHQSAIYHWDGKTWTLASPWLDEMLQDIAAIGQQAWAVGDNGLILKWNGRFWTESPNPVRRAHLGDPYDYFDLLYISMLSPDEGWAAGPMPPASTVRLQFLHYKDGVWRMSDPPRETKESSVYGSRQRAIRWNGQAWLRVDPAELDAQGRLPGSAPWVSIEYDDKINGCYILKRP